jgi:hypothetical protein
MVGSQCDALGAQEEEEDRSKTGETKIEAKKREPRQSRKTDGAKFFGRE